MAIDHAIFISGDTPTLRFYSWEKPALSIGHFQKLPPAIIDTCARKNIEIIRRPTGGRAILHQNEITYCVSSRYDQFPQPVSLKGVYNRLAKWQIASLGAFGINASLSNQKRRSYQRSNACFSTSTPYEISVNGKKIAASAQKRGKNAFLQHGSILIEKSENEMMFDPDQPQQAYTTLVAEGFDGAKDTLIQRMISAFEMEMECRLCEGGLTDNEKNAAIDWRESSINLVKQA